MPSAKSPHFSWLKVYPQSNLTLTFNQNKSLKSFFTQFFMQRFSKNLGMRGLYWWAWSVLMSVVLIDELGPCWHVWSDQTGFSIIRICNDVNSREKECYCWISVYIKVFFKIMLILFISEPLTYLVNIKSFSDNVWNEKKSKTNMDMNTSVVIFKHMSIQSCDIEKLMIVKSKLLMFL